MKSKQMEVVRGSGNVFRDFGHEQADVEQFKAILAVEIIKMLDREGLSVRGAHSRTGIAAAAVVSNILCKRRFVVLALGHSAAAVEAVRMWEAFFALHICIA